MMTTDFVIERDEHGQRYAYPVSEAGVGYFQRRLGDFDLSEQGWELDTTATAHDEFLAAIAAASLTARAET